MPTQLVVTAPVTSSEFFDVAEVLVRTGERVASEQPLVRMETEKAYLDYPSPAAGVVAEVLVRVGDRVPWRAPLVVLEIAQTEVGTVPTKAT